MQLACDLKSVPVHPGAGLPCYRQQWPAGDHFVEGAAEEVNVAPRVAGLGAGRLFQTRIIDRAVDLAADLAGATSQLCKSKVHELGRLVGRNEDVGRLQVAMG